MKASSKTKQELLKELESLRQFEVSHFRKDGSTLPFSVQVRIGNSGDKKVVLSIASDITESKEKENVPENNCNKIPGIL